MVSVARKWDIPLLILLLTSATVLTAITPRDASALPNAPSGVLEYVPITLTNNQASATPSGFQEMITVDWSAYGSYVNSGVSNVEFFDGSGTPLNAWCQSSCSGSSSSSTVWVNLGSDTIAGSGGNLTIYLGFVGPLTNNMGDGANSVWGEAANLSPIYGEYDDGANVFSYYLNAESVPGVVNEGTTYQGGSAQTSNSGLGVANVGGERAIQVADTTQDTDLYFFLGTSQLPSAFVATMWIYSTPGTSDNFFGVIDASTLDGYSLLSGDDGNYGLSIYLSSARTNLAFVPDDPYPYSTWYSATLQLGPSGALSGYDTTGLTLVGSGSPATATNTSYTSFNMVFFAPFYPGTGESMNVAAIVVRAYPPDGTMPGASFGSLVVTPAGVPSPSPPGLSLPSVIPQNITISFNVPGLTSLTGYYVTTQGDTVIYNTPGFNAGTDLFPYAISTCYVASENLERVSGFFSVQPGQNSTELILSNWDSFLSSASGWPSEPACAS